MCAFIFGPLLCFFFRCEMPPANTFTQRTPAATARTRNTLLEPGVKHIFKDKISAAVSLCLFRFALPLAAFVVDAALLVGSMIFLYHTYVRVHMQRS